MEMNGTVQAYALVHALQQHDRYVGGRSFDSVDISVEKALINSGPPPARKIPAERITITGKTTMRDSAIPEWCRLWSDLAMRMYIHADESFALGGPKVDEDGNFRFVFYFELPRAKKKRV